MKTPLCLRGIVHKLLVPTNKIAAYEDADEVVAAINPLLLAAQDSGRVDDGDACKSKQSCY